MSQHAVDVRWERAGAEFKYKSYSRSHEWDFGDAGVVQASSAPDFLGDATRVDPEAAFVASLSSCHMLWFLALAAKKRFVVDSYTDNATGVLEKNEDGLMCMTRVTLKPHAEFSGDKLPSSDDLHALHDESHRQCFIANSVRTEIAVEPC